MYVHAFGLLGVSIDVWQRRQQSPPDRPVGGVFTAGTQAVQPQAHRENAKGFFLYVALVILDNLATHKNAEAQKAMRRAGCWFLFLPLYSPDLNPIEMAFSKLMAHLRRIGARTFTDMFNAIAEVLRPLLNRRVLELLQGCRVCFRLKAGCFNLETL